MTDEKPKGAHQLVKEARAERLAKEINDMSMELRKAVNACGDTDFGVILLQYLESMSHIHENPAVSGMSGDLCPNRLWFNMGRQSVYNDLRNLMDRKTRLRVEFPEKKELDNDKRAKRAGKRRNV